MKEITLQLPSGSEASCLIDVDKDIELKDIKKVAAGKPIILIYGPGSLIIRFFSENFRKNNLIVIFDDNWTSVKDQKLDELILKEISSNTIEKEADKINSVIKCLKEKLGLEKIGLLGFSSLAVMAIKIAALYPKNIDYVIGIGCPTYPIDKFFAKTLTTFLERNSSSKKSEQYQLDQKEFKQKLDTGNLSPNSLGVAGWFSMKQRFYANADKHGEKLENWRFGLTGKIFDPTNRDYFFDVLLPKISIEEAFKSNTVPTSLFFGEEDGIVPPSDELLKSKDSKQLPAIFSSKNYQYHIYEDCGHYAMQECSEFFDRDVGLFLEQLYNNNIYQFKSEEDIFHIDMEGLLPKNKA
jgi:pimeloyl-ACP methyl ester carboxylesterase